jgi:hypothetical protein
MGQVAGVAGFVEDGVDLFENFFDGHGVHLAAVVVAGLDGLLQIAAGGLGGERVGDGVAGAFLLLNPGKAGHGDPHSTVVDVETDVDGVGMASGDGDNVGLPAAVENFAAPAVGGVEILVHGFFSVEHFRLACILKDAGHTPARIWWFRIGKCRPGNKHWECAKRKTNLQGVCASNVCLKGRPALI